MAAINIKRIVLWASDDEVMVQKLREWKLIAEIGEVSCDKCGKQMQFHPRSDGMIYWRSYGKRKNGHKKIIQCNNQVSIRKNTIFENTNLSFEQVMIFVHEWLHYSEMNKIMVEAEICSEAVSYWNKVCQEVAKRYIFSKSQKIGGPGKIVEIDESKFGKRKYNRGHTVEGQWVFGGIERESGDMFLVKVEKRDPKTLVKIIHENILPGTTIYSDCWRAYNKLDDEGFEHYTVNHSANFKDPITGVHTNTIEGAWRHAKHRLPEYRRNKSDYPGYFARYLFFTHCRRHHLIHLMNL